MPLLGSELTIPVFERAKMFIALDRTATLIEVSLTTVTNLHALGKSVAQNARFIFGRPGCPEMLHDFL
jgi:hypothetical protein